MTPTRADSGAILLSNSIHLPPIVSSKFVKPVMLPPGLARSATNSVANGIGDRDEDDRDSRGLIRHRFQRRRRLANNHVRFRVYQFLGVAADPIDLTAAKTIGNLNVVGILPAEPVECLPEGCHSRLRIGIALRISHQHADMPDAILRASAAGRRNRRAADKCDELAAFHPDTLLLAARSWRPEGSVTRGRAKRTTAMAIGPVRRP